MSPHASSLSVVDLVLARPTVLASVAGASTLIDASERDRLRRLRHPGDRLRFIVGRYLVRHALGRRWGIDPGDVRLAIDRRGRVRLVDHADAPGISIAHAGDAVVVAILDRGRVGVDIEPACQPGGLARFAGGLTVGERDALAAVPPADAEQRALMTWTAKEAYAKLTGHGLCLDFTRLALERVAGRPRIALDSLVIPVADARYALSVAAWLPDGGREFRLRWLDWRSVAPGAEAA